MEGEIIMRLNLIAVAGILIALASLLQARADQKTAAGVLHLMEVQELRNSANLTVKTAEILEGQTLLTFVQSDLKMVLLGEWKIQPGAAIEEVHTTDRYLGRGIYLKVDGKTEKMPKVLAYGYKDITLPWKRAPFHYNPEKPPEK